MLKEKEFSILLKRYLEGKVSLQERKAVDHFYDSLREEMPISQEELDRRGDEIWLTLQRRAERKNTMSLPSLTLHFISGIAASLFLVMAFLLFKVSTAAEEKLQVQVINGESVINNNFENGQITTSLGDEGYDRLHIVCKLLNAEYETIDTKVYSRGLCR